MIHQTQEKLTLLNLPGMLEALKEQCESPSYNGLTFEERLAMLVDREFLRRANVTHARRRKGARLKTEAVLENVDFSVQRSLHKAEFLRYSEGEWIRQNLNMIITGPTGVGKTFLASALADKACRMAMSCLLIKLQDLIPMLLVARADGSYEELRKKFLKIHLLIIDEWMRDTLPVAHAREILDLLDDRYSVRSSLFVAQVPVSNWHSRIEDPTIADAILDRIIHNAHRIELKGESVRRLKNKVS